MNAENNIEKESAGISAYIKKVLDHDFNSMTEILALTNSELAESIMSLAYGRIVEHSAVNFLRLRYFIFFFCKTSDVIFGSYERISVFGSKRHNGFGKLGIRNAGNFGQ